MNDLDRDLRELFHDKARSVDAASVAPQDVLRRGRRRQITTVAGGGIGALLILSFVAVAIGMFRNHAANMPANNFVSPRPLEASTLMYRVDAAATVATGSDLGHTWEFRAQATTLDLRVDGSDAGGFTAAGSGDGACTRVDVSGGTFLLCEERTDVSFVRVSTDTSGEQPVADGRWMPVGDPSDGRAWIVALPGEGAGSQIAPGDYPLAISWPSRKTPQPGDVTSAGTSDPISWAIRWTDHACPVMEVVFSAEGDTGTSTCLIPWDGSDPAIGGVYGPHEASIIVTGPGNMFCDVDDPSGLVSGAVSGGKVAPLGGWADTRFCVLTIPVGDRVTVRLVDTNGHRILGSHGALAIEAVPGSINIVG